MNKTFVLRDDAAANELWCYLKANWREQASCNKPLAVVVSLHKVKRSTDQNARYWKILSQISEQYFHEGKKYRPEMWAEVVKEMFLGMEELPNSRYVSISTTTLSVGEFGDFMDRIEAWAVTELNVHFEGI